MIKINIFKFIGGCNICGKVDLPPVLDTTIS